MQAIYCAVAIGVGLRYTGGMSVLAAMMLASTLLPLQQNKIFDYHDHLLEMCEGRAGVKCCRASVHAMRAEQARLKSESKDCPRGMHAMSLSCPASFNWCSFKTIEEVRGGGARGEKLK